MACTLQCAEPCALHSGVMRRSPGPYAIMRLRMHFCCLQGDRSLDRILPRPYVAQWKDLEQQVGWGLRLHGCRFRRVAGATAQPPGFHPVLVPLMPARLPACPPTCPQHQERQRRAADAAARQRQAAERQRAAAKRQQPAAVIMADDKRK